MVDLKGTLLSAALAAAFAMGAGASANAQEAKSNAVLERGECPVDPATN